MSIERQSNSAIKQEKVIIPKEEGDNYKKEKEEQKQIKEFYTDNLKNIFEKFYQSSLDWRLIGGTALSLCLDKIPEPYRSDGTVRDVDIIILDEKPENLEEIDKFFEKEREKYNIKNPHNPVYPEVSIFAIKNKKYLEEKKKTPVSQLVPHILRDGSRFFLQFRDIWEELDPKILEPYTLEVETNKGIIKAESFNPQTLVHLYLKRIGCLKLKDIDKIKNFLREYKEKNKNPEIEENHNLYLPFHRLAKKMREKYKIVTKAWQLYNLVDYKLFNSALSHKIVPEKIIKIFLEK